MLGFKLLTKLHKKKYRKEQGVFLVEGKNGVADALALDNQVIQLMVSDSFLKHQASFLQTPQIQRFFGTHKVVTLADSQFNQVADTSTPQGIAALVKLPQTQFSDLIKGSRLAILDDVRDPGNLGTMIRTADWFGLDGIILLGGADAYQSKVVRSSMGSIFHVPIFESQRISEEIDKLKSTGFEIVTTRPELSSAQIKTPTLGNKTALIFGNEAHGTSIQLDQLADTSFSIPKFGQAESLNVAVSFGIVWYELTRAIA